MGAARTTNMPIVQVVVSADADTPNMLLSIWICEDKTVGQLIERVNTVLIEWDDWEGDQSICVGPGPVWGDGWDMYDDDDCIWECDGWDPEDDGQMMVAFTENCGGDYYGEMDFECQDEWVFLDLTEVEW